MHLIKGALTGHLEFRDQGPGADKTLVEERNNGRTFQGTFPDCPPGASAGLVVQSPPQQNRVYQFTLVQGQSERLQKREVGHLPKEKELRFDS